MENIYFYCAVIGGSVLLLQTLLTFLGGDPDLDIDAGPDVDAAELGEPGSILFALSFKTVLAFVTFFGLGGMACIEAGYSENTVLLISLAAGLGAFYMVALIMRWLMSLQSKGNLDLNKAVGSRASVYLRIPGQQEGAGKVSVAVGGRRVIRKAVTKGAPIPSGAEVVIDAMASADTFEVSTPQT